MLQPAAIGTWGWIQQSTIPEICHQISLQPSEIIDSLAQEILTTNIKIDYTLYSKVFSLIYTTTIPLNLCLKIENAMKSIGLFEIADQNQRNINLMLCNAIEARELDNALAYFSRIKRGYGFEEVCNEMFILCLQYNFDEFIIQALRTLTPARRQHILDKALVYSANNGHIKNIPFWLRCGASLYAVCPMEQVNKLRLKTSCATKSLFHIAALNNNQELALLLIQLNFDINQLGDFNPLNHFIEMQNWTVVNAYVQKYNIVGTSNAQIAHTSVCSLIQYATGQFYTIHSEQMSTAILIALFNTGFDLNEEYLHLNGKTCSMLDDVCSVGNGQAFLTVIRALNGVTSINHSDSICNSRLAEFFKRHQNDIEDIVFNLLWLEETRQSIFNILFIIAGTYKLDVMFDALLDRDLPNENLLKNLLSNHSFSDDCLLNLLWKYKSYRSVVSAIPIILKSVKRRLNREETIELIKLAHPVNHGAVFTGNSPRRKDIPEIFQALMEKELPYKTTRENNLLDIVISHFHIGGTILLLLNNNFHVLDCGKKILSEAIKEEDELLLDRAIALGVNLDTHTIDGIDILSFAIYTNKRYTVKLLIQRGRNPDKVLSRPFQEGYEDYCIKPIELAVKNKRYEIATYLVEKSEELKEHPLSYQALFPMLFDDKEDELGRKNLLLCLFKDFSFMLRALNDGPLSNLNNHIIDQLHSMTPGELTKIESSGRSIFEVPWLLDRLPSLGFRMLRGLTHFQAVLSLEKLQMRLKNKAPQAFHYLLGIDQSHYHKIKLEPVLEPMIAPLWNEAVDNLIRVYKKHSLAKYTANLHQLKTTQGNLDLGLDNYPKEAAAVFQKHFNGPFLINEMANLIDRIGQKKSVVYIFDHLFAKPATCVHIHETLMMVCYGVWEELFFQLIDKDSVHQDDEHVLTAEHLRQGAGRIILYTSKRKAIIGTPRKKTPEIEHFYATIRRSFLQVLRWLDKCQYVESKRFCLIEVGMAGNRCGGRWLGCLHQQMNYLKENKAQLIDLIDEILIDLRFKRQVLFEQLMDEFSNDVHIHNQLYKMISTSLGLPGGEIFEMIHDNFENINLTKNKALAKFHTKYHPSTIITAVHEFLKKIYCNSEKREILTYWIKDNLPIEMRGEFYQPIIIAVAKAMAENKSRNEILQILGDIIWNPDEKNPLKAIDDYRFREFLDEIVLDDAGQIRVSFVIYMLLRINVLSKPERQKEAVV